MKNDQRSGHGSFVRTRGEKSSVSLLADNSDIFFLSVAAYFPNFPPLENKTTATRACRYQRDSKERRDAFFIYSAFFPLFSNVRRSTSTRTRPNCKRWKTDATISGGTRAVEKLVPSTTTLFSRGIALDARPSSLSSSIYNAVESTRFTLYELPKAIDSRVRITEQVNSVFVHVIVAIFLQRNAKREERKTQRLG